MALIISECTFSGDEILMIWSVEDEHVASRKCPSLLTERFKEHPKAKAECAKRYNVDYNKKCGHAGDSIEVEFDPTCEPSDNCHSQSNISPKSWNVYQGRNVILDLQSTTRPWFKRECQECCRQTDKLNAAGATSKLTFTSQCRLSL